MYIAGSKHTIDTGDTYFTEIANSSFSGRKQAARFLQRNKLLNLPISDSVLEARIEHARFIVDCPNCSNAEFAFEDKLFFCSFCQNSNIGGRVYKVKMPKQRRKIEALLAKRPIKNRHWYPNETIEDLEKENTLHRMGVEL